MINHIHIRDFAIVDQLALETDKGMIALTGETGAGKSILLDALGLALGDRADSSVIRHQAERAEINLAFDLADAPSAMQWLEQQDLQEHQECFIRRVITREGRSRGFINGRAVPMQSLRELGEMLVDIHGQHEHQSLLKREIQRQLVDHFAGNETLLGELYATYQRWKSATEELDTLRRASEERNSRIELLHYQVSELEQLGMTAEEIPALNDEHQRLANAGRLLEGCHSAQARLYDGDDETIHAVLGRVSASIDELCAIDGKLADAAALLSEAMIQIQEAVAELRNYSDRLDLDPERLQWVDERIGTLHELARKHHTTPEELPELLTRLQAELNGLDHADELLLELQDEITQLQEKYRQQATTLGKKRRQAASTLNREVSEMIQQLGMPGARFEINLKSSGTDKPSPYGYESLEFMVSTNPGQPVQPLSKIASGGELSRVSLAIQVSLADSTRIPTLIYDEVDSGIGGPTAEVVGRLLRRVGESRQVLCVTHLPQVAAQAQHHLQVSKHTQNGVTRTRIKALTEEERIDEIARMLGGVEITKQSRAHALEMIEMARPGKPVKKPSPKKRRPKKSSGA